MIRAKDITTSIDWQEGLLLAPHHFQQQDRRQAELTAYHAGAGDPSHYGVVHLVLEQDKLPQGLFSVVELEAVMPDGLVVTHEPGAGELSLDMSAAQINVQGDEGDLGDGLVMIWLAVRSASAAMHDSIKGRSPRFYSTPPEDVADEAGGPERMTIPRKAPRLQLSAGPRPGPAFSAMPLARLQGLDGPFTQTDYIPPMLWVGRGHELSRLCASLVGHCREKAMLLSSRVEAVTMGGSAQLEARMRIAALVRRLPRIEALLSLKGVRPLPLYLALCDLMGEMIGLDSMGLAEAPPVYRHEDLRACFEDCATAVKGAMQRCLSTEYVERRFVWEGKSYVLRECGDESELSGPLFIGVMENAALGRGPTHQWVESARIGAFDLVPGMVSRREIGPARTPAGDDVGLSVPARVVLYRVEADPDYVLPGQPLCIQNDAEPEENRPAAIVLYARSEQAPQTGSGGNGDV
jgi:type VI secretion system protein ImpJ